MTNLEKCKLYDYIQELVKQANEKYALAERYKVENEALSNNYINQAFKIDDDLHLIQNVLSLANIKFDMRYRDKDDSIMVNHFEFEGKSFVRGKTNCSPTKRKYTRHTKISEDKEI